MGLENIAGIFVLGLLNYKVIREFQWFEHDESKTAIDISTILIVISGVLLEFLGALNPFWFVSTILFFEMIGLVVAVIMEGIKKTKKGFLNLDNIKPLDL